MQVLNQINNLIENLESLRPLLSDDQTLNRSHFNEILKKSLNYDVVNDVKETSFSDSDSTTDNNDGEKFDDGFVTKIPAEPEILATTKQSEDAIDGSAVPYWVNPDYSYDPSNPRKPYMVELMKALSSTNASELYCKENLNSQDLYSLASELLYGVLGPAESDTRDWASIMNASDIVAAARQETNKLHNPVIDIASEFDQENELINQYAVLNSSSGKTLKALHGNIETVEYILDNFGVKSDAIPPNLEDKILVKNFDAEILKMLNSLPEKSDAITVGSPTETLEALAVQSHIANLSKNSSEIIPPEEFDKL